MRLPPHVPSQAPLRPARSALRFSQVGLRQTRSMLGAVASRSRSDRRRQRCRFVGREQAGLTARLDVRVAPAEKEQLAGSLATAGIAVAELVRLRALGRPVVSRTDATTIRELRRLGGLLKMVHVESGGAYRRADGRAAQRCLRAAIGQLAAGSREAGTMIVKKVPTSKLRAGQEQGPQRARPGRLHRRSRRPAAPVRRWSTAAP